MVVDRLNDFFSLLASCCIGPPPSGPAHTDGWYTTYAHGQMVHELCTECAAAGIGTRSWKPLLLRPEGGSGSPFF